jgi:hypothetical protein
MVAFEPVSTIADLETLDEDEILEGYQDGMNNFPCGDNRSRSYWHGWRNGMADFRHIPSDESMWRLANEAVDSGYLRRYAHQKSKR